MKAIYFETLKGLSQHDGGLSSAEIDAQALDMVLMISLKSPGILCSSFSFDTIKDPMIWFLVGIGTIFLITGELKPRPRH